MTEAQDITYFMASSTFMSVRMTWSAVNIKRRPMVGFGVPGTKTETKRSALPSITSFLNSLVIRPMLNVFSDGKGTKTTWLNDPDFGEKRALVKSLQAK